MATSELKKRKNTAAASEESKTEPTGPQEVGEVENKPPKPPVKEKGKTGEELRKQLISEAEERDRMSEGIWNTTFIIVTIISFLTRVYQINEPNQVVFDEVHFGKFASYYLRGEYFFDVHPPLGKMLLALTGWFVGYDGHFLFDNIGDKYEDHKVPYIGMRMFPALCGTLIPSVGFLILKEIGLSIPGALFGAAILILDNALICQSRLILLDSMLLLFGVMSIYTWIKFFKQRNAPFSVFWWFWLAMTGVSLALTLGYMVGLFTIGTVGIATLVDLWRLLDINRKLSNREFARHFAARALCLIFLPLFLYLSFFYIHFKILTKSGPGDAFMSPAFQAELQGSEITSFSVAIPYGANMTFKHRDTSVFLHSHIDRYPLRYDDGRISSEGQQVTGYPHRDINNHWELVPVDNEYFPTPAYVPTEEEQERGVRYIRHGDLVRLRHAMTDSYLLTHDVASPLTPTHMEMTTYPAIADQGERYNDTLFRIEVLDGEKGEKVKSKRSHLKIVSVQHRVAVNCHKGLLPEWGFGQQEINGNKNQQEVTNIWYVDEVFHERIVNGTEIGEDAASQKGPDAKRLSFLQKFAELQSLMISHNAGLTKPHPYSSTPITWPFVLRGISFWEVKEGLRQIYLLGNPLAWWVSIVGTLMYAAMYVLDRILLRRGYDDFGASIRRWWDRGVGFLFLAWFLHWIPFFLMGRMLFVHHYLPSFIFSGLCAAAVFEFIGRVVTEDPLRLAKGNQELASRIPYRAWMLSSGSIVYFSILAAFTAVFLWSFIYFAPLTYGYGFNSIEELRGRKWMDSWDLQHA
ncbi:hypothetical protein HDU76_003073 [Blyttiomyces sp. JEL0837]|nr:hypothetical protein HDU76_003073 [Blyttiomyces sp. JEL0837]